MILSFVIEEYLSRVNGLTPHSRLVRNDKFELALHTNEGLFAGTLWPRADASASVGCLITPTFPLRGSSLPHHTPPIATVAAAFVLALALLIPRRPPAPASASGIPGSRHCAWTIPPGLVADANLAAQLADVGVILLMFGVGLHFSFDDLFKMRHVALPGALVQMAVATALGALLAMFWGWGQGGGRPLWPCPLGCEHRRASAGA